MVEQKVKNQKLKVKDTEQKTEKKTVKKTAVETVATAAPVKTSRKSGGLTVDVYGADGKVVESMELPKEMFGVKVNSKLVAQAVRVYLANQRAGTASTKTRGEVTGSTRKIYRQKGTGRARHGGVRAPIFVHGGIAHGPKPKDMSLVLPQKMKRAALFSVLSSKAQAGAIKIVTGLENIEKTKQMGALLSQVLEQPRKGKVLFVLDGVHNNVIRSVRNLEGVTYDFARQLHTYEVLTHTTIVFVKPAVEELKKTFIANKKGVSEA